MSIAVFPASGGLGGATLSHLLDTAQVAPSSLVLIARSPEKLAQEKARGVTVLQADYDQPETFEGCFKGVEVLNLISYASFQHKYRFKVAKAAIDASIRQGVRHIFYSSLAFARDGPITYKPHVMLAHLATEEYLASLVSPTFSYTVIRQGLYAESLPVYTANFDPVKAAASSETDLKIRIPHDGSSPGVSWAKRDELGEATARLMSEYARDSANFRFHNKMIILSGSREYSLNETVAIFSKVLQKSIKIEEVSMDEYADQPNVGYGSDSTELNRLWATAFEGIKHGEAATVTPYLDELLGREPEDFETTVRGMLAATGKN